MNFKHSLSFLLLILASCSYIETKRDEKQYREFASIESFPVIPQIAFVKEQNLPNIFNKWNQIIKRKNDFIDFNSMFYIDKAPKYKDINSIYQEVLEDIKQVLNYPNIPDPKLVITKDSTPNAFVMGQNYCIKLLSVNKNKTRSVNSSASVNKIENEVLELTKYAKNHSALTLSSVNRRTSCIDLSKKERRALFKSLQKSEFHLPFLYKLHKCKLLDLEQGLNCPTIQKKITIKKIIVSRTLPFVFFNQGFFSNTKKVEHFRAVVAHELGHYYLGHAFSPSLIPSYFYDRLKEKKAFRPSESSDLNEYGLRMLNLGRHRSGRTMNDYFTHSISGEAFISVVQETFYSKFKGDFKKANIEILNEKVCKAAYTKENKKIVINYMYSSKSSKKLLLNKVNMTLMQMKNCLKSIRISENTSYDNYLTAYVYLFFGALHSQNIDLLSTGLREGIKSIPKNAWEAYKTIEPVVSKNLKSILTSSKLRKLGYYTHEEEADVFAQNYLKYISFDPRILRRTFSGPLKSVALKGSDLYNCYLASENNWTLNNLPYTPYPKDFLTYHHDPCFRLFNSDKIAEKLNFNNTTGVYINDNRESDYSKINSTYKSIVFWSRAKRFFTLIPTLGLRVMN